MYWMNFWQPTVHVEIIFLKNTLTEVYSLHLYASFGTIYAKIDQLFEAEWVFELCLEIDKTLLSKENVLDFEILSNV